MYSATMSRLFLNYFLSFFFLTFIIVLHSINCLYTRNYIHAFKFEDESPLYIIKMIVDGALLNVYVASKRLKISDALYIILLSV